MFEINEPVYNFEYGKGYVTGKTSISVTVDFDGTKKLFALTKSVGSKLHSIFKGDFVVNDNRYTAAVLIYDREGNIVGKYAANQEVKGEDLTVTVEGPADVFYVDLVDYALNESMWRVNFSGHEDTEYVTSLTVDQEEMELKLGDIVQFEAHVGPEWLAEGFDGVVWSSDNNDVVYCLKSGMALAFGAGEATVTATTVATDENGNHLTASIKVTVIDPNAVEEPSEDPENDEKPAEDDGNTDASTEASSETEEKEDELTEDDEEDAEADAASEASSVDEETSEELGGNE